MTKIYSGFGSKILLTLSSFIIYVSNGYAQTCATEATTTCQAGSGLNFDGNASGFQASGSGGFNYSSGADGSFVTTSDIGNGDSAVLLSPHFNITGNNVSVGVEVESNQRNSFTYEVHLISESGIFLATCTGTVSASTGLICVKFSGITPGSNLQFRFVFTNGAAQGRGLEVDDFQISPVNSPLAVKLSAIDVKQVSNGMQLTWSVGAESDLSEYKIERSDNGNQYYNIGSVNASGQKNYTYTDRKPTQGTVYYRIKALDVDGTYKYSAVVNVKNGRSTIAFNAFPIPTKGRLWLQHNKLSANATITVNAADGRILQKIVVIPGAIETNIDLTPYNNGLYIIHLNNGNSIETIKITKQ